MDKKFIFNLTLYIILIIGFAFTMWSLSDKKLSRSNLQVELADNFANQQQKTTYPELLTREELSTYLGISEEEVGKLSPITSEGYSGIVLPYVKIGNNVYFPKKAIDKWLLNTEASIVE
jgi:hypothetical protein